METINTVLYALVVMLIGYGVYLLGHSLIDAYFRRKERFVDHLAAKIKEDSNGTAK
jgi:hypothetical protein